MLAGGQLGFACLEADAHTAKPSNIAYQRWSLFDCDKCSGCWQQQGKHVWPIAMCVHQPLATACIDDQGFGLNLLCCYDFYMFNSELLASNAKLFPRTQQPEHIIVIATVTHSSMCGLSPVSPGRLVLSIFVGMSSIQLCKVKQNKLNI